MISAALLLLAACAESSSPPLTTPGDPPIGSDNGICNPESIAQFLDQTANAQTGEQILNQTGAEIFQWVGPGQAVTMDFRPNRVRVFYGPQLKIIRITCG